MDQKSKKREPERGPSTSAGEAVIADQAENKTATGKQTPVTTISRGVDRLNLEGRKKLSGAQKRKLKKLRKAEAGKGQGPVTEPGSSTTLTPQAAEPGPSGLGKKRGRSDGSEPISDRPVSKRPKATGQRGKTYGEALSGIQAVVVPHGYPEVRMDEDQMGLVQSALLGAIDGIAGEGTRPRFLECRRRGGTLAITAFNEESLQWLKTTTASLVPWEGARLSAVEPRDLPKFTKFIVWIPGHPDEPETIMRRLENQNGELRTGAWRLINRKVEEKGQTLVLSVDEMSVKVLQKEGFRPFLNFTRVLFRNLEKGRVDLGPSDEDQEGPKSVLSGQIPGNTSEHSAQ
ncbi:uncharacterized protein LOC111692351 [Anoplophora glabripennis]|uniref:uncharacterized protein LOC111692351 n=1 Tax=Anoplophora glabripennis TaxID=217634 RepID=UPI000C75B282|nr:uncharacterized protein LOC111692351 [Anoplophora glabripennis]